MTPLINLSYKPKEFFFQCLLETLKIILRSTQNALPLPLIKTLRFNMITFLALGRGIGYLRTLSLMIISFNLSKID